MVEGTVAKLTPVDIHLKDATFTFTTDGATYSVTSAEGWAFDLTCVAASEFLPTPAPTSPSAPSAPSADTETETEREREREREREAQPQAVAPIHRVFINGLPFHYTTEKVHDVIYRFYLEEHGDALDTPDQTQAHLACIQSLLDDLILCDLNPPKRGSRTKSGILHFSTKESAQTVMDTLRFQQIDADKCPRELDVAWYNSPAPTEDKSKSVFVRGLAKGVTGRVLMKVYEKYGQVQRAIILRDKETDASRCQGVVTYHTPEAATAALTSLKTFTLQGSVASTVQCRSVKRSDGSDNIYVQSIPADMTQETLRDLCEEHVGPVVSLYLKADPRPIAKGGTGLQSGGVRFETADLALKAMDVLPMLDVGKEPLECYPFVYKAKPKPRGRGKPRMPRRGYTTDVDEEETGGQRGRDRGRERERETRPRRGGRTYVTDVDEASSSPKPARYTRRASKPLANEFTH
ncbi:hypothetical protein KIPB_000605 [Kipferlia bialata]|uniref:RRM domain-containing protein n=1 Tax=Kipferlia bialata TaxID=797122 RepID=A0A9K3CMR9_9EUKA|nr:hypothetical protein KIPB_000605 [Kipferlia bialata]|eukprot:g605.t1